MVAFINRERQTTLADYTSELFANTGTRFCPSGAHVVLNWIRAVIQSVTSIIVTAAGFYLISQDISGAQAGFILSFALSTSQGELCNLHCCSSI
jgi:hypothetical protein